MSKLKDNAINVLEQRYLAKDSEGNVIETPDELFRRVGGNIAEAEIYYYKDAFWEGNRRVIPLESAKALAKHREAVAQEFYEVMSNLDFLPNTPTLINSGRPLQMLSACFVLPVEDNMTSIFDAVKNAALIHQAGGGTGFNFSKIRTKGEKVESTGGSASGPISFMGVFDAATETIKQGGTRRGANMGILSCIHNDVEEFIECKKGGGLQNFNLSVAITDDFMEYATTDEQSYAGKEVKDKIVSSTALLEKIAQHAWENGDPGVIFIDAMNKDRPHEEAYESTNPCGEQPLLPYESCNLGSINLANHVFNELMLEGKGYNTGIDWDKLAKTVKTAVHFLDNVIDMNKYTLPEIEAATKKTRKIGLGVMGWADMLVALGIDYDSDEAVKLAEKVMSFIQEKGSLASLDLGDKRGVISGHRRNSTITTIAPTGSISIIAGCSGGIEPHFAKEFTHETGLSEEGTVLDRASGIESHVRTAMEISPEWHIKMQAAFQKYTDNAVSKTINMPNTATVNDVREAIIQAWKSGCKGLTVYRDGSRGDQPLKEKKIGQTVEANFPTVLKELEGKSIEPTHIIIPEDGVIESFDRPKSVSGETIKVPTGCGAMYVTINESVPEVFSRLGKAGGCPASQSEAIGRLVSLALKNDIEIEEITHQLNGISCHKPCGFGADKILSCADAMSHALEIYNNFEEIQVVHSGACPDCGGSVSMQEGCLKCEKCGYSEC